MQLLASQQLALAHMVGHLGEATRGHAAAPAPVADDGDEERGVAHTLSHVCTTCISGLGFDAIPAGDAAILFDVVAWARGGILAVPPGPTFKQSLAFLSRAPPLLRN